MDSGQLSILIIDKDLRSRNFLSALLLREGHAVQVASVGKEGYISALRDHPDVVIFDAAMNDISPAEFIRKLRADSRTAMVRCVALATVLNDSQKAELTAAGCNDYMIKSQETIQKLIGLIGEMHPQVQDTQPTGGRKRGQQLGLLAVFLSAKGGTGTSSLCANIAHSVANTQTNLDVAVMDMVMPIGSISSIVGSTGDFNLVKAAAHPLDDLNGEYLRRSIDPMSIWNFRLLAGAPDPESANSVDASHVPVLIRAFRQTFDVTFVDLGRSLSRISLPIILEADVVTIVTSSDFNTLSITQVLWNYLQNKGLDARRVYLLMNRAVGLEGLGKSDAERILGMQIQATIPYMGGDFTLANNQHLPVLEKMPNDTAAMMLDQVARQILETARKVHV
jgi:Flp pilus assembly CpaE family ATPase